jgi:hypothetical protein
LAEAVDLAEAADPAVVLGMKASYLNRRTLSADREEQRGLPGSTC